MIYIQQLYTGCLAQAAYYIESEGEAAIIDPLRDIKVYMDMAKARDAKIIYILETHFHADFVSGHIDLAKKTGAKVIYGPKATASYPITIAEDGQEFPLGSYKIKALHTPGHTIESSCYLVMDKSGKPEALFSGDTLFVGEVGRVDLAASHYLSTNVLASMLYDSLEKLKQLPDEVVVYPGHGAGSACGKNIGKETTTTIGEQRIGNYALQPMSREEFIDININGLSAPPRYFFTDAIINHKGYDEDMESLLSHLTRLSLADFQKKMKTGTIVLDTRQPADYIKGHIPGSVNIGLEGQYAITAGTLFDNVSFLIVCEAGKEKESAMRLARVGYDKIEGYLEGGVESWKIANLPLQKTDTIDAADFLTLENKDYKILDVRNPNEFEEGVLEDAITIPLPELEKHLGELDKDTRYYIYCRSGNRSMVAASLMQSKGYDLVTNIEGGMIDLEKAGAKVVALNDLLA